MDIDLASGSVALIDSSALVYLVEGEAGSPRRGAVESFFAAAAEARARVVASTIVWMEALAKPLAENDVKLATRYRSVLSDSSRIELIVVDVAIAERATAIRAALPEGARRRISQTDALHIATAIECRATTLLTNDEAWRSVPACPRVYLVDELAFDLESRQPAVGI
jgi:predicted nucleic acid-binding protein